MECPLSSQRLCRQSDVELIDSLIRYLLMWFEVGDVRFFFRLLAMRLRVPPPRMDVHVRCRESIICTRTPSCVHYLLILKGHASPPRPRALPAILARSHHRACKKKEGILDLFLTHAPFQCLEY